MITNHCSIKYITTEQTHEEWVAARLEGIGGSDAGAIVGASRYASQFSLYHEKRGSVVSEFPATSRLAGATALSEASPKSTPRPTMSRWSLAP